MLAMHLVDGEVTSRPGKGCRSKRVSERAIAKALKYLLRYSRAVRGSSDGHHSS